MIPVVGRDLKENVRSLAAKEFDASGIFLSLTPERMEKIKFLTPLFHVG